VSELGSGGAPSHPRVRTVQKLLATLPLVVWCVTAIPIAAAEHWSFRTNAFDLSVFDYALWSTLDGRLGQVPFMGHSLFSHHFMPSALLLLPAYALAPSPALLIAVQLIATAGAAVLLGRLARGHLPEATVAALQAAFLFARPSYNAFMGFFYIESLIPLLVFALLLAWQRRSFGLYALLVILTLGCKEDVALYLGGFGLIGALRAETRRAGLLTALAAAAWLALAVGFAIPLSREHDGLPRANPFLQARYASSTGAPVEVEVGRRLLSGRSVVKVFNLTGGTGLLCWLAPEWLLPAAPGVLLNLAARRDSLQSAVLGHYALPVIPWIFAAAVVGASRVVRRFPRAKHVVIALLFGTAALDTPFWLHVARGPWRELEHAAALRAQLRQVPEAASVLAQPNLIPHLPHRRQIQALGREVDARAAEYVLLADVGDLWPLGRERVHALMAAYSADARYERVGDGPLVVFRRRDRPRPH